MQFFTKIAAALIRSGGLETKLARFITTQKIEINSIIIRLEIFDKKSGVSMNFPSPDQGWAVVPGQFRDPGSGAANPRDRDRDLKPRDKNMRDSPGTKIPTLRDKNPGQSRRPGIQFDGGQAARGEKTRDCPVPCQYLISTVPVI